jgi:hypothetical protein
MRPADGTGGARADSTHPRLAPQPPAAAPDGLPLPPDERSIAGALLMRAAGALTGAEHAICIVATRPGAAPLDWRSKLRLSVAAGQILGSAAL